MAWHSLQSTLARALPDGVLQTGHRLFSFSDGPDGVAAEFETAQGVRRLEARLLIGADGGQSAVRQALLGDGPPEFLGGRGRAGPVCGEDGWRERAKLAYGLAVLPVQQACAGW